ncbi:MAG: hypothetical protein IJP27_08945 [Clostridia bacterium]|nr:hypothetical protein [Clostridia bacterium]
MKKVAVLLVFLLLFCSCKAELRYSPVEKDWPEKRVEAEDHHAAPVIPWEELPLQAQYFEIPYQGVRYSSRTVSVAAELCEEQLDSFAVQTGDYTGETVYECKITLAKIQGISCDCAVAVRFDGGEEWFAYTNPYYKPKTLGDLIADLNLEENLVVGSAWYHSSVEFPAMPAEEVWKLLRKTKAENVYSGQMLPEWMAVEVSIPLLGIYESSLRVTEEGYLVTNLLDTGKAFFIGEEAVENFVGYVTNQCQGYRVVYE